MFRDGISKYRTTCRKQKARLWLGEVGTNRSASFHLNSRSTQWTKMFRTGWGTSMEKRGNSRVKRLRGE